MVDYRFGGLLPRPLPEGIPGFLLGPLGGLPPFLPLFDMTVSRIEFADAERVGAETMLRFRAAIKITSKIALMQKCDA